ncbi:peptide-methionine (S)-S-oxide reductase MsrA [Streptomyces sp. NBC_00588]|uniref:peptide-methionine (S)-S-oxide reductase MsrA n=1 Tax=Streptomyces sp. NBC_00588 TaxID=2975784 RepID=UPI002E80FA4A|nr:peptide-methionine (S)-S-oxide reductase MsrA [Streptomyces sp. NBC_00588]WUB41118.1 peptide-methionine (S)-S-oxide reductase MsrA [Streptomyces sp. NBC_00588]
MGDEPAKGEGSVLPARVCAVLAGGCFWGVQELFRTYPGVVDTRVGYTGGEVVEPTYRNHGNHAEAAEVTFDPSGTDYRSILEFFFQIHDPTTLNRQGDDVGLSFRSAIFYLNEGQRSIARAVITDCDASGLWPGKLVTEVVPSGTFWEAEPEHQHYLQRHPDAQMSQYVRTGWKLPRALPGGASSCGRP